MAWEWHEPQASAWGWGSLLAPSGPLSVCGEALHPMARDPPLHSSPLGLALDPPVGLQPDLWVLGVATDL